MVEAGAPLAVEDEQAEEITFSALEAQLLGSDEAVVHVAAKLMGQRAAVGEMEVRRLGYDYTPKPRS